MITDGPAAAHDTEWPEIKLFPFAHRLASVLTKAGVLVAHEDLAGMGRIGLLGWVQIHCNTDEPESLAVHLMSRFGKFITFGDLVVPRHGLEYVALERAHRHAMRHIISYFIQTDSLIQRWDVLIKATELKIPQ